MGILQWWRKLTGDKWTKPERPAARTRYAALIGSNSVFFV